MEDSAREVTRYCREVVGDGLRSAIAYGNGGQQWVYIREDLRGEVDVENLATTLGPARDRHSRLAATVETQPTLGDPEAVVNVFENALTMQLFVGGDTGVVLTFERDVGRDLCEFADALLDIISDELA